MSSQDQPILFAPFESNIGKVKRHLVSEALQSRGLRGELVESASSAVEEEVHAFQHGADTEVDVLAFQRPLQHFNAPKRTLCILQLLREVIRLPSTPVRLQDLGQTIECRCKFRLSSAPQSVEILPYRRAQAQMQRGAVRKLAQVAEKSSRRLRDVQAFFQAVIQ